MDRTDGVNFRTKKILQGVGWANGVPLTRTRKRIILGVGYLRTHYNTRTLLSDLTSRAPQDTLQHSPLLSDLTHHEACIWSCP